MNISLYQAASALEGAQQRQDVIAENLAAAGVPGYKRHNVGFHSVNADMFKNELHKADKTQLQFMLPRIVGHIDFQQGTLMRTGDNTNLSIDGPGFFAVTKGSDVVYSRDGSFHINSSGQLVTKEGYPLRAQGGGAPITVDTASGTPVTIANDGTVSQGGAALGQLEVVKFEEGSLKNLKRLNAGFFAANGATPLPVDQQETKVAQGFLEGSNTTPTREMGELMTTLRHFEANQKIMKIHDENMGKLIRELGTVQ